MACKANFAASVSVIMPDWMRQPTFPANLFALVYLSLLAEMPIGVCDGGVSLLTFRLESGGLGALAPQKPGPRRAHKLDADVMDFLEQLRSEDSSLKAGELARRIDGRFGRKVHPRSIERALTRQEKKRP